MSPTLHWNIGKLVFTCVFLQNHRRAWRRWRHGGPSTGAMPKEKAITPIPDSLVLQFAQVKSVCGSIKQGIRYLARGAWRAPGVLFIIISHTSFFALLSNVRQILWRSHSVFFLLPLCLLHFLGHTVGNFPVGRPVSAVDHLHLMQPLTHTQPFIDDEHVLQVCLPVRLSSHIHSMALLFLSNFNLIFTISQSLFPSRHYALSVPAIFLFTIVSVALFFVARVLSKSTALL